MKYAFLKTLNSFKQFFPIIFGVIFLLGFVIVAIPQTFYSTVFSGNRFTDPLLGALIGSVSGGNPITSYILGDEFLKQGVSLLAVTAFILAWVTVGVIQLPAESLMLGKRFAIIRNVVSFFMAIIIAVLIAASIDI